MKILFLDTEPIRRGAQIFISELSSFLRKNGNECRIVYLYNNENLTGQQLSLAEVDRNLDGDRQYFVEKLPGVNPVIVKKLIEEINRFSPEVLVANGSRTLKYAALARQFCQTDTLWIARWIDDAAFWNPRKVSKWIYSEFIISQFDGLIAVSQASLESMIRHYAFKKPTTVIHRVFDPNKFQNAPNREEARKQLGFDDADEVLLFLGNLTAQKRPDRFIEILKDLAKTRPRIKGILVGDGPLRKILEGELSMDKYQSSISKEESQETRDKSHESRVKNGVSSIKYRVSRNESGRARVKTQDEDQSNVLSLATYVSFKGYQSDVSPFLAAADLLILTSDTEGLPGVVLEAAYFSVPTVATEVGGIRECLINGQTGILIPDREVPEFCSAISSLLDDPERRKKLGEAAKTFVDENFRMEIAGQQYLDFFKQLIEKNRS